MSIFQVRLTIHTGDKPIQCRWCPLKFAYSSVYRSHKHKVHFDKIVNTENTINATVDNIVTMDQADKIEKIQHEPFIKNPEEQSLN